jgi:hypothetical protein
MTSGAKEELVQLARERLVQLANRSARIALDEFVTAVRAQELRVLIAEVPLPRDVEKVADQVVQFARSQPPPRMPSRQRRRAARHPVRSRGLAWLVELRPIILRAMSLAVMMWIAAHGAPCVGAVWNFLKPR